MRKETINYLELGIKSYTEKTFSKYKNENTIIYSQNFDNDFINPNFVNLIQLYKNMIEKNKISKLWNCVAESIKEYSYPIFNIFEKELNSLNKKDISININYDRELAGINLNKFKSISIATYLCIKGCIDITNNFYDLLNEDIQKFKSSLDWLYNFCLIKDNINIYSSFIINFIIRIPIWIHSLYTDFNEKYLKWLIIFFSEKKEEKRLHESIIKEINNIINDSKKNNNAFTILKKSQTKKFSRSRGQSFDKGESTQTNLNYEQINNNLERNLKIENYFKILNNPKKQEKKEKEKENKENDYLKINQLKNFSFLEIDIYDNSSRTSSQMHYHYSCPSEISFDGNSQKSLIGINSLLKVNHSSSFKILDNPFYKNTLSYKKEYSSCKKKKFTSFLLKTSNNENINFNNVNTENNNDKNDKIKSIQKLIHDKFYDNQINKKSKSDLSTNDKTKKKKNKSKSDIIAYKTPIKSINNSLKQTEIDKVSIRKNLLNLFQQNNN